MYESDKFLFNVDKDFVQTVTTPLLVLEGNDLYHPSESSLTVNELAQNATLIRVEEWSRNGVSSATVFRVSGTSPGLKSMNDIKGVLNV